MNYKLNQYDYVVWKGICHKREWNGKFETELVFLFGLTVGLARNLLLISLIIQL